MKLRSIINSVVKSIIMTGTVIALMSISAGPVMANTAQDGKSAETAFLIEGGSEAEAWNNLKAALSGTGEKREDESAEAPTYIKLVKDCTCDLTSDTYIDMDYNRSVVLDLNGHKIDRNHQMYDSHSNTGYVIGLISGAKLTVTDSTADDENPAGYGLITGGCGDAGGGISLKFGYKESVLILRGGTISGNRARSGSGVYLSSRCRVEVDGGIICDNHSSSWGGGIGGTDLESYHIEIKGGKIDGNTAGDGSSTAYGGGIGISEKTGANGSFIVSGGEITNNSAVSGDGGGVYTTVSFTLAGGIISGNRAEKTGGGICQTSKKFIMEGGIIRDNTAAYNGGGLCLSSASSATLRGGSISGNGAGDGGGVFVNSYCSLTTEDGFTITGNTANNGGGVYHNGSIDGTEKFDMKGGEISGNTADRGGGIYSNSTLNLTGGRITGNNAGKGDSPWGGGVFYYCEKAADHALNVSGSPIVIGNVRRGSIINGVLTGGEDDNVYLYSEGIENKNVNITVSGNLSKDALMGASFSTIDSEHILTLAAASPGYQSGNLTDEDISHFTSDYRDQAVILKEDEGVKVAKFTDSYFGTDHVTVRRGAEGSELTLAQYDTSGKMTSVQRKIILKDVLDEPLSDMGISIPSKGAYKLMLSDRRTGIPLYDAISSGFSEESGGSGYNWISDDTRLKTYSDNVTLECRSDGMPYYRLTCKIDDRDYRLAGIGYILTAVLKGRTGETGDDIVYADQLNYNYFGTNGILKFDGTGSGFALRKNWSSEIYLNGEKVALIIPENEEPSPSLITKDPVGKTGLKYDGSGQELIIPGKAENGTMYYAVTMKGESRPNKASFSAELPKKTNPGTYTVWYMSKGNGNYIDTEIFSLDVSIADEKGHIHKLIHHSFKDSTYTEEGNIEYWECDECHLFFDRNGNVITDVVIKKKDASKEEKEEEGGNDDEKEHKKTASELAEERINNAKKAAEEGKGSVTDTVVIKKTGKTLALTFEGTPSNNSVITVAKGNKFKINGDFKGFKSDSKAVKVTKKGKVTAKKATLNTPANITFTGANDGPTYTLSVHVLDPADKSASEVISGNSVKIRKMTISAKASDLIDISLKGVPLNAEIGKISDKKKVTEALPGNESIIAIGDDGFYHLKAQLVKKGKVKIPFKVNGKKFRYTLKIKK